MLLTREDQMAEEIAVRAETQRSVELEPAVVIGHLPTGQFMVHWINMPPERALALLEHAKASVLSKINPNAPRLVERIPSIANLKDLKAR
jgi:hypothetical protein